MLKEKPNVERPCRSRFTFAGYTYQCQLEAGHKGDHSAYFPKRSGGLTVSWPRGTRRRWRR